MPYSAAGILQMVLASSDWRYSVAGAAVFGLVLLPWIYFVIYILHYRVTYDGAECSFVHVGVRIPGAMGPNGMHAGNPYLGHLALSPRLDHVEWLHYIY